MTTKLDHLQSHCERFTKQLEACTSIEQAQSLKERVCSSLQDTCQSVVVRELLDEHSNELIRQRFSP